MSERTTKAWVLCFEVPYEGPLLEAIYLDYEAAQAGLAAAERDKGRSYGNWKLYEREVRG